ncbi:NAD(P)-binding protein [Mycena albidolilacea]|uniref:NAD(P)-binding protein n=1 Tax=Mycena albidolilacea TaxID=1033008 RepID=A0AAD7AME2_9AGAR|nr:NAD(P)-binding protein [Mycena albidolilacea]
MTITQDGSAPLIAVVGATGNQGGSVVRALADSDKPYRVRGFTRDPRKPAALELSKLGVAVVGVTFVVENKDEVNKAFTGADFAFLVTNFWEHVDIDREIAEGKLLIDAAKAGGVSGIVWSGLPSISKISGGKFPHVWHFDGKAVVTEYGRQAGVPFVDVQAGAYGTNFFNLPFAPEKQSDGSFALQLPVNPTTAIPFIDTTLDYGIFVRYVLELPVFPDGGEFAAYAENISVKDLTRQWSQATGKNISFAQITVEEFKQRLESAGFPPHIVLDLSEALVSWDEFGWKVSAIPQGLVRSPRKWADFVKATDWSKLWETTAGPRK